MRTSKTGRVRIPVSRPQAPPVAAGEVRRFAIRLAAVIVFCLSLYWTGWRSPWARADLRVRVESPDAPKAAPPALTAPEPQSTRPALPDRTAVPGAEDARAEQPTASPESDGADSAEPGRRPPRRGHRRSTSRRVDATSSEAD